MTKITKENRFMELLEQAKQYTSDTNQEFKLSIDVRHGEVIGIFYHEVKTDNGKTN